VRSTGLGIRSVQIALMELALAGRIERHGGGLVSLTPPEHSELGPQ
jgi:DNA processing protein